MWSFTSNGRVGGGEETTARRVLALVADATLAQLGVPDALRCCEYLLCRWTNRSNNRTDTLDHERKAPRC